MNKKQKKNFYRIIISSLLLIILGILNFENEYQTATLYLCIYLIIGYDILKGAVHGILNKQVFDENFLMSVATIGAMLLKEYREGVMVMLLYQIGELFQSIAISRSRKNISDLMDIRPDYANKIVDGKAMVCDPYEVGVGDEILVKVGEKIPLDGIVVKGTSMLNTCALTGESKPKTVMANDNVISGCINMEAPLTIKVTKEFDESTASKILDLV